MTQRERNKKIIDAVIRKADAVCPGSLALIGIYGSFAAGGTHPGSDLDLLIVVNDSRGQRLSAAFVQEDMRVGHDIYCTTWDDLRAMARFDDPHIARLMDSVIVYCADEKYAAELDDLRRLARERLDAPFSREDYDKAEAVFREAERYFALALMSDTLTGIRTWAGAALYFIEDALAMLNKHYFRRGVKQCCEELSALENVPEGLSGLIGGVVSAGTADEAREKLAALMRGTAAAFKKAERGIEPEKKLPSPEELRGTYEEMYSNWRNKMRLAARTGDRHLAFMSLTSFGAMLAEVDAAAMIGGSDAMAIYDPEDLEATADRFDDMLERYLAACRDAGVKNGIYPDVDSFVRSYLNDRGPRADDAPEG